MNCLLLCLLGNFLGALLGPFVTQSIFFLEMGRVTAIFAFIFGVFYQRTRILLWPLAAMIWIFVHNPSDWTIGVDGEVVLSNGCGFVTDDLLIHSFGRIQISRGRSLKGDIVRRSNVIGRRNSTATVQVPMSTTSFICRYAGMFRKDLLTQLSQWPPGRREWLQSFLLGADMKLDSLTTAALRRLGLLHIVVLSGSHLAVLSMFSLLSLRFLPLVFFSLRVLSMRTWTFIWTLSAIFSFIGLVIFAFLVGLPQSVQRALVLCLVLQVSDLFWIRRPSGERLVGVWLVQTTLFPVHILSLSMFLSWSGSLILSGFLTSNFRKSWFIIIREKIFIQTMFSVLALLVFGNMGIASIFANILFSPLFSLALPANLLILFSVPKSYIAKWFVESQMFLLMLVRKMDDWQLNHPWSVFEITKTQDLHHVIIVLTQIGFVLLLLGRLFWRTKERHSDSL